MVWLLPENGFSATSKFTCSVHTFYETLFYEILLSNKVIVIVCWEQGGG